MNIHLIFRKFDDGSLAYDSGWSDEDIDNQPEAWSYLLNSLEREKLQQNNPLSCVRWGIVTISVDTDQISAALDRAANFREADEGYGSEETS